MFVIGIVNRQKRFSAAKTVALAGVLALEFIQASSVKRIAIMFLADRLFVPGRHEHVRGVILQQVFLSYITRPSDSRAVKSRWRASARSGRE
jgi:hypothetical protein